MYIEMFCDYCKNHDLERLTFTVDVRHPKEGWCLMCHNHLGCPYCHSKLHAVDYKQYIRALEAVTEDFKCTLEGNNNRPSLALIRPLNLKYRVSIFTRIYFWIKSLLAPKGKYDLKELLDGITEDNLHSGKDECKYDDTH